MPDESEEVRGLREEMARLEDRLWEQQAALSKAYSDLAVRNQALTGANDALHQREKELSDVNRSLEQKVAEQLQQIERTNRLRRYFSPDVANTIVSVEGADLSTHKRLLTIFFADISSFDELMGEMESEEIIEVLSCYHREMTGVLFRHGGTLDKFITARIMGFFGDPVPQADHAARAVRAAIEMRERLRDLRGKWFAGAESVELQVGIHTGYATVGNVGSEHRFDYTAIGKNVSMASSLELEARPGQVLLSAKTWEVVKESFDVELQTVSLKGLSRPMTAYAVIGERSTTAAPTASAAATIKPVHIGASRDAIGKRLGAYLVQEVLGQGGMGIVYKALDERLQRVVALKVLPSELSRDETFAARFKREARALASLNSPNVAQIYAISDQEVPPFFAMEYVEGGTLRQLLAEGGKLPLRRALDLATQMARGLQAAAEKGVIHRDVKPDNVMLTARGQVKLTDFGLVKTHQDPGLTTQGVVMGTPLYMSPEQAEGKEVDFRSDIYSLGATLFHMLAGHPPFRGESALVLMRAHAEAPLPPLSSLPGSVSANVYAVIQRMMTKDRNDRYPTYDALIEALDAC
ncbi:MAG: protein kinase [Planctomycetota bacterium]